MTIKKSQAFAAFRTSLLAGLQNEIASDLAHQFNAELEDIRIKDGAHRVYIGSLRVEGKEQAAVALENLADKEMKARVLDLKLRRQAFLDQLTAKMHASIDQRVADYGGTVATITEPVVGKEGQIKEGQTRNVKKAQFDDGSMAKIPSALWVDYSLFQRL